MEDGGEVEVSPEETSLTHQEEITETTEETIIQSSEEVVEQSSVIEVSETTEMEQSTEVVEEGLYEEVSPPETAEDQMAAVEEPAAVEESGEMESLGAVEEVSTTQFAHQEISQESMRNQLEEINQKLENPQPITFDNTVKDSDWHTWRPRGTYDIPKVEVKFGDMKTPDLPDITLKDAPKPVPTSVKHDDQGKPEPVEMIDQYAPQQNMMNGDLDPSLEGLDIPYGIPLLARVLPRECDGGIKDSIPLERLFTPATDSGEITPRKKKAFSNSAFYAPNHPTIEDQVSLAQKISCSLVDDNNKMSRGQSMYIKRKKRSVKWIHGAGEDGYEEAPMMEMKHLQFENHTNVISTAVSEHSEQSEIQHSLQQVVVAGLPLNGPMDKHFKPYSELQSPTGKGAELFAKRKKRMDQFIVDETTVKKSSHSESSFQSHEESSSVTTQSESFSQQKIESSEQTSQQTIASGAQYLRSTCTAVQPTIDATVKGVAADNTPVYTAEVKVVQHASLPHTRSYEIPEDMPHHSLIEQFDSVSKEEKRRSFNFAAKGWGTYANFYTPISFTAATS